MPWNGSGTFNRIYSWVADKAAGLDISSSRMDTDTDDITANGFGNTLTRDGQGQPTANLPMNGFRHTGVQNAVARTDYASLGQVQDGLPNWTVATGTADAIIATFTPALTTLADGQLCFLRASAPNATTTPTFAPNGLTARTITRGGGAALVPGDIPGALAEIILRYNSTNTRWELLNPAQLAAGATLSSPTIAGTATFSGTGAVNLVDGTTGQRPGSPATGAIRFNSTTSAFEGFDGTAWRNLNSPSGSGPSPQALTSGTTYTTPAGALYLVVEMVGGGGGGGGSSNGGSPTAGGSGSPSNFNSVTAAGGGGGAAASTATGGGGGSAGSGGSGTAVARFQGAAGDPGNTAAAGVVMAGGSGGPAAFFGGRGSAGANSAAGTAQPNTGAGGGGAGSATSNIGSAGGGGAGEYARLVIANPASTYSYAIGAGGSAGTGSTNGGAGAAGVILVTAYFQ